MFFFTKKAIWVRGRLYTQVFLTASKHCFQFMKRSQFNRTMKHNTLWTRAWSQVSVCLMLAVLMLTPLALTSSNASAQSSARIHHSIKRIQNQKPGLGRDLWFMLLTNYGTNGTSGKYFALYVTSPNPTTVHVQITGGAT